jgi:hypothetical protein
VSKIIIFKTIGNVPGAALSGQTLLIEVNKEDLNSSLETIMPRVVSQINDHAYDPANYAYETMCSTVFDKSILISNLITDEQVFHLVIYRLQKNPWHVLFLDTYTDLSLPIIEIIAGFLVLKRDVSCRESICRINNLFKSDCDDKTLENRLRNQYDMPKLIDEKVCSTLGINDVKENDANFCRFLKLFPTSSHARLTDLVKESAPPEPAVDSVSAADEVLSITSIVVLFITLVLIILFKANILTMPIAVGLIGIAIMCDTLYDKYVLKSKLADFNAAAVTAGSLCSTAAPFMDRKEPPLPDDQYTQTPSAQKT